MLVNSEFVFDGVCFLLEGFQGSSCMRVGVFTSITCYVKCQPSPHCSFTLGAIIVGAAAAELVASLTLLLLLLLGCRRPILVAAASPYTTTAQAGQ
jgi:hypothetical protein